MNAQISFEILILMSLALAISLFSLVWLRNAHSFDQSSLSNLKNYSCDAAAYASDLLNSCANCITPGVAKC